MTFELPIWLASASPRRRLLMKEAGFDVCVRPSDLDDADLVRGCASPLQWVVALAWFKARRVADLIRCASDANGRTPGTILAADTVCAHGNRVFGQPRNEHHARNMLLAMRDAVHCTMTGVCLLPLDLSQRLMFVDQTEVRVGRVTDEQIERYLTSGEWRGKAGAYNLNERLADGWPIECTGDPATVMGLPMRRLRRLLPDMRS